MELVLPLLTVYIFFMLIISGYGNQVPSSVWGRFLTYTLGFISILIFGGVLATAGSITTHLMNDLIHRCKRKVAQPWIVLMWGCLWVLWMVVIMYQSVAFQRQRLEEPFAWNDAFWFAYISTTTIGFGDFYLQPEGLFVSDLLGFWGTFLLGFVLLSSFLTELSNMLGSRIPNLGDHLRKQLKYAYGEGEAPEELHFGKQAVDDDMDASASQWSHVVMGRAGGGGNNDRPSTPTNSRARPTTPVGRARLQDEPPPGLAPYCDVEGGNLDSICEKQPSSYGGQQAPKTLSSQKGRPLSPEVIEVIEYVDDSEFGDEDQVTTEVIGHRPNKFTVTPGDVGIGVPK